MEGLSPQKMKAEHPAAFGLVHLATLSQIMPQ